MLGAGTRRRPLAVALTVALLLAAARLSSAQPSGCCLCTGGGCPGGVGCLDNAESFAACATACEQMGCDSGAFTVGGTCAEGCGVATPTPGAPATETAASTATDTPTPSGPPGCCLCTGGTCPGAGGCLDNAMGAADCNDACAQQGCASGAFLAGGTCIDGCGGPTVTPVPTGAMVTPTGGVSGCVGDCDGDGGVAIAELVRGVAVALGLAPPSACPELDHDGSGTVTVDELVTAVQHALDGCPVAAPLGAACATDSECTSGVCDDFEGICCNRKCAHDEVCREGRCAFSGGRLGR